MTAIDNNRILALRPEIETEPAFTVSEQFQNQTLRPVLKMQNDLLIGAFRQYISRHKDTFRKLSVAEQQLFVAKSLRQDHQFRHFVRGIIAGHFTETEWRQFVDNEDEINKRMMKLAEQRIISQLTVI
ncbi:hypothetical protein [Dyadobacter sp. NIV53]|uniref:hypothetical protein n=1 Tax=Dyadobacter sp. NIV53 TaxID=2861765 RepID=UPI001C874CC4|nr:hypothetical protein [Dyadobacter sp. NIV53]